MSERPPVYLYTDGACRGNPGPGGWAAVLQYGCHQKELTGSEGHTTNNRMELTAVAAALSALKRSCTVTLVTDSQYVKHVLGGCKVRANQDLVYPLRQLASQHQLTVEWVRGHSGHILNERADELAVASARAK